MQAPATLIVGQGLAGTCLAWELWWRGAEFLIVDREAGPASSRVAAGLINPVTGKTWSLGWRYAEFFAEARAFYQRVGAELGGEFLTEFAVVRLVADDQRERVAQRLAGSALAHREVALGAPWRPASGIEIGGAGRVDLPRFLDASREFFRSRGRYRHGSADGAGQVAGLAPGRTVFCEGAAGLLGGVAACLPSRCAKGEILTVEIPALAETRLVVGNGGWLVPIGNHRFRAGATYQWDNLDAEPTPAGRGWVEALLAGLLDTEWTLVEQLAGIRPIVRQSRPVVMRLAADPARVVFNGLGSKGALYAPGTAARLAAWLLGGAPLDPELAMEVGG